jgi:hypothetical protein
MEAMLRENIALLSRTPGALDALLRGLPGTWTSHNEGGDTWTVFQILGHLVHCERNDWMTRARIILDSGTLRTFPALNRTASFESIEGRSLDQLLDEFTTARSESLTSLEALHLGEKELTLEGTHPAFGAVTLGQLLSTWTTHDLTHLHQIARVMAYQRREAVGPWKQYLGVLKAAVPS